MPWIAIQDGEKKGPFQVPKQTDVECETCGGRMRVWSESTDGRARHFKHVDNMGHGEGGSAACETVAESDKHLKWKNLAAQQLKKIFDGNIEECRVEKELDAPKSDKDRRIGDAVVLFNERDRQLGRGIVMEVQYKNHTKDIEETTEDYLKQHLAVVWTYQDDYGPDRCRLAELDIRKRAQETSWPEHVPGEERWRSPPNNYQSLKSKWRSAYQSGLSVSGAPATLPPEWCDEKAREIWESTDWAAILPDYNPVHWDTQYDAHDYIQDVRSTLDDGPPEQVRLPPEWCDETAQRLWNQADWGELFPSPSAERLDALNYEYQAEVFIAEVRETLNSATIEIPIRVLIDEDDVWRWYNKGLEQREDTHASIPPTIDWGGVDLYMPGYEPPEIEVVFPYEYFEQHRNQLELHWSLGAGVGIDLDLAYRLSENSAVRRCIECGRKAAFYLYKQDILSEFLCEPHAEDYLPDGGWS